MKHKIREQLEIQGLNYNWLHMHDHNQSMIDGIWRIHLLDSLS